MDYFLTFTCNQKEHFGMSKIKRWIYGNEWERYFPKFENLSDDENMRLGEV